MKLLSPVQHKNLEEQQKVRDILRAQELSKVTDEMRKRLAEADAEFEQSLARKNALWAEEDIKHEQKVREMTATIKSLETKENWLRLPIKQLQDQADAQLEAATQYEKGVLEKEERLDLLAEELQDKLDQAGQMKQDLLRKAQKLELKKKGIKEQEEQVVSGNKLLNEKILEFKVYQDNQDKDIDERKTALVLWDRSLQAKEQKIKRTNERFNQLAKKLESDRAALQAGFDELRRLSPPK